MDKSIVPRRFLVRSQSEPGRCRRCFPASVLFFDIGPGILPGGEKIWLIRSARSCSFCSNRWRIHSRPSAKTSSSIWASVGSRSGSFCIILILKHRSCLRGGGKGGIAPRLHYSSSVKMRTARCMLMLSRCPGAGRALAFVKHGQCLNISICPFRWAASGSTPPRPFPKRHRPVCRRLHTH